MTIESSVTFFPCRDLMQTADFYTQTLGLILWKKLDGCMIFESGRGYLGFCDYGENHPMAQEVCLSFNLPSVEAVDEAYQCLCEQGVPGIGVPPRRHDRFPVYSFFLTDPNGYWVELQKILN